MISALADEAFWPKEALDRDYNARSSVSTSVFEVEMENERKLSDQARTMNDCVLDVVYDRSSGQKLDIYATSAAPRPVFLYIHGGY